MWYKLTPDEIKVVLEWYNNQIHKKVEDRDLAVSLNHMLGDEDKVIDLIDEPIDNTE